MSASSPGQSFFSSQTTNTSLAVFSSITTPPSVICHLSLPEPSVITKTGWRLWCGSQTLQWSCVSICFFFPHIHRVRELRSSVKLDPRRSKTWVFKGQTILSTVSWLSCWKELRCLNLDFSHGLTQANVPAMRHAWQQALQPCPAARCPRLFSLPWSQVTKLTLHPQPPPAPPSLLHRWGLLPSPATPPGTKLQKLLLPAPAQSPRRLSPTTVPPPPAPGIGSPLSYPRSPLNSHHHHGHPYPTPHSQGKKNWLTWIQNYNSGPIYHKNNRKPRAPKTSSSAN